MSVPVYGIGYPYVGLDGTTLLPLPGLPGGYACAAIPPSGDLSGLYGLDPLGTTGFIIAVESAPFLLPDYPPLPAPNYNNASYFYGLRGTEDVHFSSQSIDRNGRVSNVDRTYSAGRYYLNGDLQGFDKIFSTLVDISVYGCASVPAFENWHILRTGIPSYPDLGIYTIRFHNPADPGFIRDSQINLSRLTVEYKGLFDLYLTSVNSGPIYQSVSVNASTPALLYYIYAGLSAPPGNPPPVPKPTTGAQGVDMLNTRTGLYIADPSAGLQVRKFTTAYAKYEGRFTVDAGASANYPTLAQISEGEGILCFYRSGLGTDKSPYVYTKRLSFDGGHTWNTQTSADGKVAMLTGKKWARIVVLGDGKRARGEAVLYNDASGFGIDGKPDGTGLLQCDLYDAGGKFVGTFPKDGKGIAQKKADDCGFGLEYVNDRNHDLRVCFFSSGVLVYAISVEDGKSWVDITKQLG